MGYLLWQTNSTQNMCCQVNAMDELTLVILSLGSPLKNDNMCTELSNTSGKTDIREVIHGHEKNHFPCSNYAK